MPDPQDIGSADRIRLGGFYGEHTAPIDAQSTFTSAQLRHALNEQWMLRGHLGHNRFYREVALTTIAGLSDDRQHVVRRVYRLPRQMSYVTTAQLELRGNVRSGGISHEVLAGLDVVGYSGGWSETAYFFLPLISVDAPQAGHFQLPDVDRAVMRGRWQGRGFFIQDVMDFGNGWGLQAGLRHERMRNQPAQATSVERMRHNSPNASLTFKPTAGSMLYLSYASSFEPNWSVQLFSGAKAGPSRGKQWELGAKQTWLDGRLNTSAALYTLRKTNIATSDLDNPGYSLLTGEVRVRGLELEASAQPLPGLELTGQATFMSPKVVANSNASIVGKAPDGTARRAASLWASYRLPVDAGRWRVGGGLFHSGRIAAGNNGLWFSPGYTTVDAMLGYRLNNHLNLRLNVKNLLDKRHYLRAYAGNSGFTAVVPGRPRSFVLTLDANF